MQCSKSSEHYHLASGHASALSIPTPILRSSWKSLGHGSHVLYSQEQISGGGTPFKPIKIKQMFQTFLLLENLSDGIEVTSPVGTPQ